MGRKKGSRNIGYFHRRGRGWYRKIGGRFVALLDHDGNHLKDAQTPARILNDAYERSELPRATILDLSNEYLRTKMAEATHTMRLRALTRFCKAHGRLYPEALRPSHFEGLTRIEAQAVRRMLSRAGIKIKLKMPKNGSRVTYITPAQEAALLNVANPALRDAIRVLIRTGMRPGEFIGLRPEHITDHGERMEFRFRPEEVKTRRTRIVRITDPEIIGIVRQAGGTFHNAKGGLWKRKTLTRAFARAKDRTKIAFDQDCCLYSCRHTFAKRVLTGYWTGKPCSIEILARLMGNTPTICRQYYLEFADEYCEPLWTAV